MISEIAIIFVLMVIDFPFILAPATVWGLTLGLNVFLLAVLYVLATFISGLIPYFMMRKQSKKFRTWKVIKKYKHKGAFYSTFLTNILAHNFDTAAAAGDHKLNIFSTMLALLISNAIYFFTVVGLVVFMMALSPSFIVQIILSTIATAVIWTLVAHYILHKLGFGW
jgi:hypothetical protein